MLRTVAVALLFVVGQLPADEIDRKYPLDPPLRILAADVEDPAYRTLVLEKMLITDLAAEWQRVATKDNPESFLERHGGKEKVMADPDLKRAYERRVAIREKFLDLMRQAYKRYNQKPPFDRGEKIDETTTITRTTSGTGAVLATVPPADGSEKHWPRFRGPSGQGLTNGASLPVKWDKDGTNLLWRVKLGHKGNSSPIVWGDRIFLTSSSDDGAARFVECYSLEGGKQLWKKQVPARPPEPKVRPKNGYASATPVTDGRRVIVFLGSCGLLAYDFEGNLQWQFDDLQFDTTHGTGSSPVLYKDKVIFIHDQNRGESVFIALDKETGKLLWKRPRPRAMTWATPVVVRVGDRDELVIAGGEKINAYDPDTGEDLWSLSGPTREVIPAIVVGKDLLYSASGRNGPIIALRPGGKGDVTRTHVVWQITRGGAHVPTPLYLDGKLYAVSDTGILSCIDGSTGKLIWQDRVLDGFSASPVAASGHIYFPAESGRTYVIKVGDSFQLESRNDLGAPILASPAVVGNRMILRTEEELVCVGG